MKFNIKSKLISFVTALVITLQSAAVPIAAIASFAPQQAEAGWLSKGVKGAAVAGIADLYLEAATASIYNLMRASLLAESPAAITANTAKFIHYIEFSDSRTKVAKWMLAYIVGTSPPLHEKAIYLTNEVKSSHFGDTADLTDQAVAKKGLNSQLIANLESKAEAKDNKNPNDKQTKSNSDGSSTGDEKVTDELVDDKAPSDQLSDIDVANEGKTLIIPIEKKDNFSDYEQAAKDGKLIKTKPDRKSNYRKKLKDEIGDPPSDNMDADHKVELCVGGADCAKENGQWLDKTPNRASGSKIMHQIKNDPLGTIYDNVKLEE